MKNKIVALPRESLIQLFYCYNFALNAKKLSFSIPGEKGENPVRSNFNPTDLHNALVSDGLVEVTSFDNNRKPIPKTGFIIIAAVMQYNSRTGRGSDPDKRLFGEPAYHFYRQKPDGSWWHKPGKQEITNLDANGNIITDPMTAERDYTKGNPVTSKNTNPSRKSGYDNWQYNYNYTVGYYYVPE